MSSILGAEVEPASNSLDEHFLSLQKPFHTRWKEFPEL